MPKKHNYTKSELLNRYRANNDLIVASNKAHMICTLAVLIDVYEFSPEDVNDFVDRYNEFLMSYDKGDETFKALNENIYDYCGIRIG